MEKSTKGFKCNDCTYTAKTRKDLRVHQRKHTGEKPFSCSICGKSFTVKTNCQRHELIHSKERRHEECEICSSRFTEKGSLRKHMRLHTREDLFICPTCGREFTTKSKLESHMRSHTGEKPFECSICGKSFTQKYSCLKHEEIHSRERLLECEVCSARFTNKIFLRKHMRLHNGEKYTCPSCDKVFISESRLDMHLRYHTEGSPYECSVCKKTFVRRDVMQLHMETHNSDREKTYECTLCNAKYLWRGSLLKHVKRTHAHEEECDLAVSGQVPKQVFRCSLCEKKFPLHASFLLHEMVCHKKTKQTVDAEIDTPVEDGIKEIEEAKFSSNGKGDAKLCDVDEIFIKEGDPRCDMDEMSGEFIEEEGMHFELHEEGIKEENLHCNIDEMQGAFIEEDKHSELHKFIKEKNLPCEVPVNEIFVKEEICCNDGSDDSS